MDRRLDSSGQILRLLNREIWIVTSATSNKRGGLCATWVSQASLDDSAPVFVIGLAANHFTTQLVDASGSFGLHLLLPHQTQLALDFALQSGRTCDKLADLALEPESPSVPLLQDCAAWFACRVIGKYTTGDRLYFWGTAYAAQQKSSGDPLREQTLFASLTAEVKAQLIAQKEADAQLHAPYFDHWRARQAAMFKSQES